MKITKSELKSIVKECLAEILNEGLGGGATDFSKNVPNRQISSNLSGNNGGLRKQQPHAPQKMFSAGLKETIRREAGGNRVMEDIFADTAASTLPSFLQNEGKTHMPSSAGGGLAEQLVANASPEDLFGDDVASKWASLAFMDSPLKK